MADTITSKLGFDVSDAISSISRLNTELTSISGNVAKLGSSLSSFNSQGSATSNTLSKMASVANNAAAAFERLAKARAGAGGVGGGRGGRGGSGGGRGGNGGGSQQDLLDQIARLQAERNVPDKASAVSQRRYQNAITQAAAYAVKTQQGPSTVSSIGANLAGNFTGQANTLANKLGAVQTAFTQMGASASKVTNKLTIDWQTFVRVVSTQVIVRSLSQIQKAFAQALEDAVHFQTQIAEIGTISSKDFGGIAGITDTVRKISDAFNVPINNAAEAYYETISNQIGNAAKSQEFFTESAKFSKSAVTDLASSVNLLSSVLNAYGKDADETGAIAGKFFRVIELGRVRASDLANTFGRVAPAAHQLGISFDELGALIATITVSGVKPAEALTQIRGVMNALVKPTEAMSKALKELGFDSAESAIQTLSLGGLLDQLQQKTDGTSAAFSKLFPNMRGINGAIIIGKQQVAGYAATLDKIKQSGAALNDLKSGEILNSDAQKVAAAINRLKTALTVDLGGSLVNIASKVASVTGGFDPMIQLVTRLIPVIAAAGVALTGYAGVLAYTTIKATLLRNAVNGLGGSLAQFVVAAGAAIAVGETLGSTLDSKLHPGNSTHDANLAALTNFKAAQEQQRTELESFDNARLQMASKLVADINKTYLQDVNNAQAANKRLVSLTRSSVEQMLNLRQRYIEQLRNAGEQGRQDAEAADKRSFDTRSSLDQKLFELRTKNLNPNAQGNAYEARSQSLARRAASQLLSAGRTGDQDGIQRAIQLWGQAESAAEKYMSIAESTGGYAAQNAAAQNLVSIAQKRISAERQLQSMALGRAKAADAERAKQEKILADMKNQAKIVIKNTGLFDNNGKQFSAADQAKRDRARNAALALLQKDALSRSDLSTADVLGLTSFATKFRDDLTGQPFKLQFNIDSSVAKMKAQIESSLKNLNVKLPFLDELEKVMGEKFATPEAVSAGLAKAVQESQQIQKNLGEAQNDMKRMSLDRSELQSRLGSQTGSLASALRYNPLASSGEASASEGLQSLNSRIQAIASGAKVSQKDIDDLYAALKRIKPYTEGYTGNPGLRVDLEEYSKMVGLLNEIYQDQQKLSKNPANTNQKQQVQRAQQLNNLLRNANAAGFRNQLLSPSTGKAISTAKTDFDQMRIATSQSATSTAAIARNMQAAATAAQEAATASSQMGSAGIGSGGFSAPRSRAIHPAEEASGGLMQSLHNSMKSLHYFAQGGLARGTDRIPTMLSANEWVMNARASRNFGPQLAAMNAGMTPNYRASGGHTSIGDINVTVNGGSTGHQTGRTIAHTIKRELRRGTVSL